MVLRAWLQQHDQSPGNTDNRDEDRECAHLVVAVKDARILMKPERTGMLTCTRRIRCRQRHQGTWMRGATPHLVGLAGDFRYIPRQPGRKPVLSPSLFWAKDLPR